MRQRTFLYVKTKIEFMIFWDCTLYLCLLSVYYRGFCFCFPVSLFPLGSFSSNVLADIFQMLWKLKIIFVELHTHLFYNVCNSWYNCSWSLAETFSLTCRTVYNWKWPAKEIADLCNLFFYSLFLMIRYADVGTHCEGPSSSATVVLIKF